MSVIWCQETTNRSGSADAEQNLRYTRTFQILTDSPTDGAKLVLAHPELPQRYEIWFSVANGIVIDSDPDSVCVDRVAEQSDANDLHNWTVTCRYVGIEDPTALPVEYDSQPVRYQRPLLVDNIDVPVLNSAGDPFQGGVMVDRTRKVITITRNLLTWDENYADQFADTVNFGDFLALKPELTKASGTCKLNGIGVTRIPYPDNVSFYWRIRAEIDYDPRGWLVRPLDAGYHELKDGRLQKIIMPNGTSPAQPIPLDGTGERLLPGNDPVYINFVGYTPADWSGLHLEDW